MRNRTRHIGKFVDGTGTLPTAKNERQVEKIPMSKIIREGIKLRLDKMDEENPNAIIIGEQS